MSSDWEALHGAVYRYVSHGRTAEDAEELTQEVFRRLYEERSQGRTIANPRGWVFRVAHNLMTDQRRHQELRERHVSQLPDDVEHTVACVTPSAEEVLVNASQLEAFRSLVSKLPADERNCLHLRSEGLKLREIAEVVGLDIRRVAETLNRAIRKLNRVMGPR